MAQTLTPAAACFRWQTRSMRRATDLTYTTAPFTCGHLWADVFRYRRDLCVCKTCGEANITLRHSFRMLVRRVPRSVHHPYHSELMTFDSFDYESLDPGIRDLVRLLRQNRFNTTDSGDGVSKPPEHRVLDYPHVFCSSDSKSLIGECDRMREVLIEAGLYATQDWVRGETFATNDGTRTQFTPVRTRGFTIQGTYDPGDMTAVIAVLGDPPQGDS